MTELLNSKTSLTWDVRPRLQNQKHVHLKQLDRNGPNNTCPGSGAWQATSTEGTILDNTHPRLGDRQIHHPLTCQAYYPRHQKNSLYMEQSPSALNNLFCPQVGLELGGLMYYPGFTKYMWHLMWHFELGSPTNKLSLTS